MSLLFSIAFIDKACIALAVALVLVVIAVLLAPHRPPPVVGQLLPHHDPTRRIPFRSNRSKS